MINLSNNRTPLTAISSLTDEQILTLKSLWIETVEELLGCALALQDSKTSAPAFNLIPNLEKIQNALPADALQSIQATQVGTYERGLAYPPAIRQTLLQAYCRKFSQNRQSPNLVSLTASDQPPDLPGEVNLVDQFPPVRNQFHRGTCTAFAGSALCEFLERKNEIRFSPQFLYWCCKNRDGYPNEGGTSLSTVQEALLEDGICPEEDWPYYPDPIFDANGLSLEGQGPAPKQAIEHAKKHRYTCRSLTRGSVTQYKRILASGYPIVIGVLTYASWERSKMTHLSGKLTMPFVWLDKEENVHAEEPSGAHAMCLVGYLDNKSVPGGGYFIARNSWGKEWASLSKVAAGHALIPYAYISAFCLEAFSVLDSSVIPSSDENGEDEEAAASESPNVGRESIHAQPLPADMPVYLRPYARHLDTESRDSEGRLLPAGTCVLSLPEAGSPVFPYTPACFLKKEYRELLRRIRFGAIPAKLRDSILAHRRNFCSKLDNNLTAAKGHAFPETCFSLVLLQAPWRVKVKKSRVVADFSAELLDVLLSDVDSGQKLDAPPADWKKMWLETISAKIRKCSAFTPVPPFFTPSVYVVEVFATPFTIDRQTGAYTAVAPSEHFVELVQSCAREILKKQPSGQFVFYSIASCLPWDGVSASQQRSGSESVVVCTPNATGEWNVQMPTYLTGRTTFRNFQDRLLPITHEELLSAVKFYVDENIKGGGVVKVDEVVEDLHTLPGSPYRDFPRFRKTAILRAFIRIAANDPAKYAVCRDRKSKNDIYILQKDSVNQKSDEPYRPATGFYRFMQRHLIGLLFCVPGVLLWFCKDWLMDYFGIKRYGSIATLALSVVFVYLGILLQNFINRIRTIELE